MGAGGDGRGKDTEGGAAWIGGGAGDGKLGGLAGRIGSLFGLGEGLTDFAVLSLEGGAALQKSGFFGLGIGSRRGGGSSSSGGGEGGGYLFGGSGAGLGIKGGAVGDGERVLELVALRTPLSEGGLLLRFPSLQLLETSLALQVGRGGDGDILILKGNDAAAEELVGLGEAGSGRVAIGVVLIVP